MAMTKRYCCQCTSLKHADWVFCPYCGHKNHYDGDALGNRTPGAQPQASPQSQEAQTPDCVVNGAGSTASPLDQAFRTISGEIALLKGKAKRFEREVVRLQSQNFELREELKTRKQPPPFRVGQIYGRKLDVDIVLPIEQITFNHPLVDIKVRLP